ncbi:SAP domain [Cordyceps militaris]|uniref:SAP domain n=1 Tax=Cordyceps militaris TaxID=73501 RepID=A0A2H4SPS9_CORMI|nr:SAP domain [Cordyceps militaris]
MADWAKLKVVDLKAELKRRDLPQHGLKAELVARLDASDAAPVPVKDETPTNADSAEPAPAAEDSIQESEAVPETIADTLESKQTGVPTGSSIEPVEVIAEIAEPELANAAPQSLAENDRASDESQKRKRKSATPSPDEEIIAAKRARSFSEQEIIQEQADSALATEDAVAAADKLAPTDVEQTPPLASDRVTSPVSPPSPRPTHALDTTARDDHNNMDMDVDRDVAPATHPPTAALYISNLMRPLRPADVQARVCELAAPFGQVPDDGAIVQFHLDQIRTHAFVVLSSVQAAERVRARLHDCVWPNESNRKALYVDFVPPDQVDDWIATEQDHSSGGGRPGRSTVRWEVVYGTGPDGVVEARLQQAGVPASRPGPPPPSGPMSHHQTAAFATDAAAPPTGPRGDRRRQDDQAREPQLPPQQPRSFGQPPSVLNYDLQRTRARPSVTFQLVASTVAQRRVDNMRAFYTQDVRRVLGRDINRYSFEDGDGFVDRGKEVFEGIRPPHRERGGRGGRGGGKFGGAGGGGRGRRGGGDWQRGDRYLPGASGGGGGGGRRRYEDDRDRDRRY